ncbi:hypothetical protein, partial [Acinetobacter baumannii]|uniref:hypothetical protein n=1 Tax=Acinetobacter baumannii TaxID=470 RepID=UPI001C064CED
INEKRRNRRNERTKLKKRSERTNEETNESEETRERRIIENKKKLLEEKREIVSVAISARENPSE